MRVVKQMSDYTQSDANIELGNMIAAVKDRLPPDVTLIIRADDVTLQIDALPNTSFDITTAQNDLLGGAVNYGGYLGSCKE